MTNFSKNNIKILDNYPPNKEEDGFDLTELLATLVDGKWLVISIALAVFSLGIAKALLDSPVYKVDVMLQLDEKSKTLAGMEPLADLLVTNLPVMAEIELIKSRMVLGKTIKNMKLDIIVKPKYFPLVGAAIARQFEQNNQDNTVSNPIVGLSRYAWGGEVIQIDTLSVPRDLRDKELILLAGKQGHFKIIYDGEPVLEGNVGKLASKQIENNQQPITIFVSQLKSRPGTQFIIKKLSEKNAITQLRLDLVVSEKNTRQNKQTGILGLTLESYSADQAVRVLNEIANIYVQQNVRHKSAETQQTLEFAVNRGMQGMLPYVRLVGHDSSVDDKE